MKLHLVLPPGPRDYWNELEVEHNSAVHQLQWLYATDPFAAKKEFEDRKAQLSQSNKSASKSGRQRGEVSGGYKDLPEVKMASTIRELVEEAVKKVKGTTHQTQISYLYPGPIHIPRSRRERGIPADR